ncbi:dihydrodipicolinate synthase family protein [Mesorhizobium shangrilense]|uniref:dihydrodipicolinate synthase family protein n=1 Tax=Mesorhizobium shangrilense TaxID=460060 RepID=UPI00339780E8
MNGISGVHVTPYGRDGSINAAAVTSIVRRIASAGIHAVVCGGNTGEFFSQTAREIVAVQEAAKEGCLERTVMIAGVGRAIDDAIELARSAERIGFDAIMVHEPADPFAGAVGVTAYVRRICDSVSLPVILYVRSPALGFNELMSLAAIDQVVGIKFARTDLTQLANCIRATEGSGVAWVCGLAEQWAAPFYAVGARGFTSGLVNVAPEHSMVIHAALERGDFTEARRLVGLIALFEELRSTDDNGANVTVVKEALSLLGHEVGRVRDPGSARLSDANRQRLGKVLETWRKNGILAEPVS